MAGQLASCNALEPLLFISDIIKAREVIQESSSVNLDVDLAPQETISESSNVVVT